MEGETSSRRFHGRHRGANRLYAQVVGQFVVRWLLLLSLLVTLLSSSHQNQFDSSSFFLKRAWALDVALDTGFLSVSSSISIQENTLPSPHTVTTAPSSENIPMVFPSPQTSLKQTEELTTKEAVRSDIVVPTKKFRKKESEDDPGEYYIGKSTLKSLTAKEDRSVTSLPPGAGKDSNALVGGFSDYDRLLEAYSAPLSTMRCQSTDAYCPSSVPICCGWMGGFYCIHGGHKCCGGQSGMTGDLYCRQSELCCTVGKKSICCPEKTQCGSALKPANRTRLLSARSSSSENEVLSMNAFRSESDTDDSNANESTEDEILVEEPVCIPSFPECASRQTQDACVAVNGADIFSSMKCGWCCKEQRCITVKAESAPELTDRSEEFIKIATKRASEGLDSLAMQFESRRDDWTYNGSDFENASCVGGTKPLTSLKQRCSSNCEYYSTCTHCVSSRRQQTAASSSRNSSIRSRVSSFLGKFTKKSNTSSGLTNSGENHALKAVEFEADESCIWCLSTAQCINGREYSSCPNLQFAVVEEVCAYSWYEPQLSRRWAQVVVSILKVLFLVSIGIFLFICYQQRQESRRREEELNTFHSSRMLPQDVVRRYGFSAPNRPWCIAPAVRTDPGECASPLVCQSCGIPIFFDVRSDADFSTSVGKDTELSPFTMKERADTQVEGVVDSLNYPHDSSPISSSQERSSQENTPASLQCGAPVAPPPLKEDKAPIPKSGENSTAKQKDPKDAIPAMLPFLSSTEGLVEGETEKESKAETKENTEEGESRFVSLLPCTHSFCVYCIEEFVQDSHSFLAIQYLRRQWRHLRCKWKWLQPRNRASQRRRPRPPPSAIPSSSTHETPNRATPMKGGMVSTTAENSAAASVSSVVPAEIKEERTWLAPLSGIMSRVRGSFSQVEPEKTPLLSTQNEEFTELNESRTAQMKGRTGGEDREEPSLEEREVASSDPTRTEPSQDRPSPGSLPPFSSPLSVQEAAGPTPKVEAVTVVHESTIPSLSELLEVLHHECPYCYSKVEHIFFADRLRRI